MKVALLSYGTRGDVQPFVSIAHALRDRGHDVVVAAPENHMGFVRGAGIPAMAITGDSEALLRSEHGKRLLMKGDARSLMNAVLVTMRENAIATERDVEAATDGADIIVTGTLASGLGRVFAEVRRIPLVVAHTFPALPTVAFGNGMLDLPSWLPGPANKAVTWGLARVIWHLLHSIDDDMRARRGLEPARHEPGLAQFLARRTSLHLWSPNLVPHPADWGPHERITGFCALPGRAREGVGERAPLSELEPFLADGPAPMFIGLGSMPMLDPHATVEMIIKVAERLGLRVLLGGTFEDPEAIQALLPSSMRLCGAVDHDALFPRCVGVLHHGGAGSTATSLRAGRPTMVCSVLGDQPFWGRIIVKRQLGASIAFRTMTASSLERGLTKLLEPGVASNAAAIGAALRQEVPGAAAAAAIIEDTARARP